MDLLTERTLNMFVLNPREISMSVNTSYVKASFLFHRSAFLASEYRLGMSRGIPLPTTADLMT